MKQEPHTNPEYDAFDSLLRRVVAVPHSEIKRREEEYKAERAKLKKKRQTKASRASRRKS
jgi:hypothetical protein